jgi:flagellar biosynthetic protein FliR
MVTGLLVFSRCAGFVFRAPGFSHPSVPMPLRGGFALVLAMLVAPNVHIGRARLDDGSFVAALVIEFLLGSALGMAASLVYDAAYSGGRIVDDYVGVKAIAPSVVLVAPSGFGRVWSLAFTGAYFLTGAYRLVILGFAQSFVRIPVESPVHAAAWAAFAVHFAAGFLEVALQVAAPAVGLAFVVQIALGSLARVVPRFGSFTLAFPLAFAAALIATTIFVPLAAQRAPLPTLGLSPGVK